MKVLCFALKKKFMLSSLNSSNSNFYKNIHKLSLFSRVDTHGCCFKLKFCNPNVQENWI